MFFGLSVLGAAAGAFALTGISSLLKGVLVASGGAYVITPTAAPLTPSLRADRGAYALAGGGNLAPVVMRAAAGTYVLTPGAVVLTRSGGDYDQVYGGVGHYREELERLRQLATITRPVPRPIVRAMRPLLRPLVMPAAPQPRRAAAPDLQAIHLRDMAVRRLAQEAAQRQAAIAHRRREEAEILLLAC